jgi:hypothetical protein
MKRVKIMDKNKNTTVVELLKRSTAFSKPLFSKPLDKTLYGWLKAVNFIEKRAKKQHNTKDLKWAAKNKLAIEFIFDAFDILNGHKGEFQWTKIKKRK